MSHQQYPSQGHHDHNPLSRGRQRIGKKGLFAKDLPAMMFGFGDPDPQRDVVALMEEMVIDHITDVVRISLSGPSIPRPLTAAVDATASRSCQLITAHKMSTNRGKLKVEDIKGALQSSSTTVHNPPTLVPSAPIRYTPYPLARRRISLPEKQLSRIEELLFMQDDLARARGRADDLKAYGEDELADGGHGAAHGDPFHLLDKGKQRDHQG